MRVELRPLTKRASLDDDVTFAGREDNLATTTDGGYVRLLQLGDIHTDMAHRSTYRPTGFQEPLVSAEVKCNKLIFDNWITVG